MVTSYEKSNSEKSKENIDPSINLVSLHTPLTQSNTTSSQTITPSLEIPLQHRVAPTCILEQNALDEFHPLPPLDTPTIVNCRRKSTTMAQSETCSECTINSTCASSRCTCFAQNSSCQNCLCFKQCSNTGEVVKTRTKLVHPNITSSS